VNDTLDQDTPGYFGSAYRNYDTQNPPYKLQHYLDVIRARLRVAQPRLLDVGCGRGLFLRHAHDRHPDWDFYGIDAAAEGVMETSTTVPDAAVFRGRADSMPFRPESFDVITAWDVLEHVPDPDLAFSEMVRCLRTGGLMGMVVPVYDGITGPLIRALDRDPTHVHKRSRRFWTDLLDTHLDRVEWHGIYRYMISKSRYVHRPTRRLRETTPAILITAFKD